MGAGVNILHYSQIKYLGKVSLFWYFGEEFLHFDKCFSSSLRILMKYANYYVDYMVYASLLGKSLFVAFGKSFLGFRKIFTPGSKGQVHLTECGSCGQLVWWKLMISG